MRVHLEDEGTVPGPGASGREAPVSAAEGTDQAPDAWDGARARVPVRREDAQGSGGLGLITGKVESDEPRPWFAEPAGEPITLRLSKRPVVWKGRGIAACVRGSKPNVIVISPERGWWDLSAESASELQSGAIVIINHESLHAGMKRAGIREWLAIDRYWSSSPFDLFVGLCSWGHYSTVARPYDPSLLPLTVGGRA